SGGPTIGVVVSLSLDEVLGVALLSWATPDGCPVKVDFGIDDQQSLVIPGGQGEPIHLLESHSELVSEPLSKGFAVLRQERIQQRNCAFHFRQGSQRQGDDEVDDFRQASQVERQLGVPLRGVAVGNTLLWILLGAWNGVGISLGALVGKQT